MCKAIRKVAFQMALFVVILILAMPSSARATEITFLCAGGLQWWVTEVIPEFQRATGYSVKPTFQVINVIAERVRKGDTADLATVSLQQWDDLQKEGKIDSTIRVVIAKLGFGVFVKKGAAKPDISSVVAFKHAFLKAHSIASFNSESRGPTNPYQAHVFEQLGISTDMNPKIKHAGTAKPNQVSSAPIFELVANGDAEIGLAAISEILQAPGVELVGPVPAEIQSFIIFTTAIPVNAKETAAAKALIDFLTSSKATAVLKSKGLE